MIKKSSGWRTRCPSSVNALNNIEKEVEWRMGDAYHHPVEFDHRACMLKHDPGGNMFIDLGGGHRTSNADVDIAKTGNWLFQHGNKDHSLWCKKYDSFYNYYDELLDQNKLWDNDRVDINSEWQDPELHVIGYKNTRHRIWRQFVLVHVLKSFPKLKVMSRSDNTWCYDNLAVFANSRALNEHGESDQVILHTDNDMFPLRGCNSLHDQNLTKWEHKKPQAVWRGTFTGAFEAIPFNITHCKKNKICRKTLVDKYTDSRFVDVDRAHNSAGPFLNPVQQSEYLCILNVEGNDTSSGNQWMFSSNSIVLMQQTHTSESPWHYHLKPWYHYVPFDINNIEERVQWCINNPDQAKSIVRNANNLHMLMTDYNREYKIMYRICQKLCENNNLL